jgi:hypothetical protein
MRYLHQTTTPAQHSLLILLVVTSIAFLLFLVFAWKPLTAALGDNSNNTSPMPAVDQVTTRSDATTLSVNGKDITIPANGEVHTTAQSDGGKTQVDIKSSHNTDGSSSHSSKNIIIK